MSKFSLDLKYIFEPMNFLSLLTKKNEDEEQFGYLIKALEQKFDQALENNKLYPHVSYLSRTEKILHQIIEGEDKLNRPKQTFKEADWEGDSLIVTIEENHPIHPGGYLDTYLNTLKWALDNVVDEWMEKAEDKLGELEEMIEHEEMQPYSPSAQEGFVVIYLPGEWSLYRYRFGVFENAAAIGPSLQFSDCLRKHAYPIQYPARKSQLQLADYLDDPLPQGNPAVFCYYYPERVDWGATARPLSRRLLSKKLRKDYDL